MLVFFSNDLLIVCNNNEINLTNYGTTWVLDNDAFDHVTSRREFFLNYTSGDFGVVKMGNDGREPFPWKAIHDFV